MFLNRFLFLWVVFLGPLANAVGQEVSLFQQFNGRYDFTFIGNTLNTAENNTSESLITTTSSSTVLNLSTDDVVEKAYLYWAGCGDGDFEVNLNSADITPDRFFSLSKTFNNQDFTYFSAFKDITSLIQSTGNGTYTLSNLDISPFEALHFTRKTNFAGWAILIIYKNENLALNQINVYDGLQGVPDALSITLNNLYVIDNLKSKVGFIAWEGDNNLATENFQLNGNALSNALNPINNVFNGTNSVTNSQELYNMDLDIYDIQNFINIGDTSANITLTSTQDFVMINTVVTKFNSQLPDATIKINNVEKACNSKILTIDYTILNVNSSEVLPANTPIAIYANNQLIQVTYTTSDIPIEGTLSAFETIIIPDSIPNTFELKIVADDQGNGIGIVNELIETNNDFSVTESLWVAPSFSILSDLTSCNEGFGKGRFDFSTYEELVKVNPNDSVAFYNTTEDAVNKINAIPNANDFIANTTPKTIMVRIDNENCYSLTSFALTTRNCPPLVHNFISANNDGYNDALSIEGLQDIFLDYKIEIYNRWGRLIWTGNQEKDLWDGYVSNGFITNDAPDGTYFYVLYLNDVDYPEPLTGYLYLNH